MIIDGKDTKNKKNQGKKMAKIEKIQGKKQKGMLFKLLFTGI